MDRGVVNGDASQVSAVKNRGKIVEFKFINLQALKIEKNEN